MSRIEAQLRKNCEILHALKNSLSQSHRTFHHATRDPAAAADLHFDHQRSLHIDLDLLAGQQLFSKHTPSGEHAHHHETGGTSANTDNRMCRNSDALARASKLGSSSTNDDSAHPSSNTLFAPIPIVPPPGTNAHVPPAISFRTAPGYIRSETSSVNSGSSNSSSSANGLSHHNRSTRGFTRRGSETIAEIVSRQMKGNSANVASQSSSVRAPRVAPPPHPSPPTLYSLMAMSGQQNNTGANSQNSDFLKSS